MACNLYLVALILLRIGTKKVNKLLAGCFRVILKEERISNFISYLSDALKQGQRHYLSQFTVQLAFCDTNISV